MKGYKHTELGWIPEDWEVRKIKDYGKVITGSTPPTSEKSNYGSDYMFIGPADLNNGKYISQSEKYLSNKGFELGRKLPEGSVLFTCIGSTIGKMGILAKEATCNQQINAIVCFENYDNEFLYYELSNHASKIKLMAGEQAVPIINKNQFENCLLAYPPLSQRQSIAQILKCWDKGIETLSQLIAAKQQLKKGLIQQLLTRKKRIGKYQNKVLFFPIYKFANQLSEKNKENLDLIVLSCTKYKGLVPSLEFFGKRIYSKDLTTYKIVQKNCFAYATNHIEEGSIGYQTIYEKALISPMYTVFETNDSVLGDYLYPILKSHHYIQEYKRRMEGSIDRRGGLRWEEFSKIEVPIPSIEEQVDVAKFLKTADIEIDLCETELALLKHQKQGLMQQLLTGKKRVKV
jgi:type I restriction enzyme S subunit